MKIERYDFSLDTPGRGTQDITDNIHKIVDKSEINIGLCHVFLKHTSASVMICENSDRQVRSDLEHFLSRLVPDGDALFKHVLEGKDDMPAHIRTILTQTEMNVPIANGKLSLGTWQGIFLYEHRYHPQKRHIIITLLGQ